MPKIWKYGNHINKFANCPPERRKQATRRAFRIVHRDENHPNNFLPPALIPGAMAVPGKSPCCNHYALSFFEDQKKASDKLTWLSNATPQFVARAGNCVAAVQIESTDGEAGDTSKRSSHFDFFEYMETCWSGRIREIWVIVQPQP